MFLLVCMDPEIMLVAYMVLSFENRHSKLKIVAKFLLLIPLRGGAHFPPPESDWHESLAWSTAYDRRKVGPVPGLSFKTTGSFALPSWISEPPTKKSDFPEAAIKGGSSRLAERLCVGALDSHHHYQTFEWILLDMQFTQDFRWL